MGERLAVITARGGSKRIPKKNIKDFCGKPIIAYSIEAALKSGLFSEVMVSTDSEEIAEIAKRYGAEIPFMRSATTSDDYATTADVLMEVLKQYQNLGRKFDSFCCIYPTAPFVTADKLRNAMNILEEKGVDTVMPVVPFSFPPQRGMRMVNERIQYMYPEVSLARSQDLETVYHDCGQFYCLRVDEFLKSKKIVMDNVKAIIVNEMEVQDIDNISDWKLAEVKYQIMKQEKMYAL